MDMGSFFLLKFWHLRDFKKKATLNCKSCVVIRMSKRTVKTKIERKSTKTKDYVFKLPTTCVWKNTTCPFKLFKWPAYSVDLKKVLKLKSSWTSIWWCALEHIIFVNLLPFFKYCTCNSENRIMTEMVHSSASLLVFTVSWDWFCIDRCLFSIHRLKYVQLAVSWTAGWCKAFYPQHWGTKVGCGGGMFGSRRGDLLNRFYTGVVIGLWASSQINTGPKLQPVGWNSPQFSLISGSVHISHQ